MSINKYTISMNDSQAVIRDRLILFGQRTSQIKSPILTSIAIQLSNSSHDFQNQNAYLIAVSTTKSLTNHKITYKQSRKKAKKLSMLKSLKPSHLENPPQHKFVQTIQITTFLPAIHALNLSGLHALLY